MDELKGSPESLGIFRIFINFILPTECFVRDALAIFCRLFIFIASSAVLAAQDLKQHLSLGGFLGHGFYIVQRLHDWIMQTLEAQAMKPVTLGRMPGIAAAQSQHRTSTRKDQNLHLTSHTNPSEVKDYCPMNAAKQTEPVRYHSSFPRDERELSQLPNGVDDEVLSSCSSIQKKDGEDMAKDQESTVPTVVLFPQKRAPKESVSKNENVEILKEIKPNYFII